MKKSGPPVVKEEFNMTTAEALALEYSVSQLQESIRRILEDAPDVDQLSDYVKRLSSDLKRHDEDNGDLMQTGDGQNEDSTGSKVLILSRNQKIQLAAKLKSLYEARKLRVFKQIAEFDETTEFTDVEPVRLSLRKLPSEEEMAAQNEAKDESSAIKMHYKNIVGPHGEQLPPLPVIDDHALEARVFTHKSLINNVKHLSPEDIIHSHNERLEFLGDSLLGYAVTNILYKRFPNANEGDLSIMRSSLVNNARLYDYSCLYGFDKRLHRSVNKNEQFLQGKQKLIADVFEAYIGGLYISGSYSNFREIKAWLAQVMEEDIQKMTNRGNAQERDSLNKKAKAELYALIGSASMHPSYIILQEGNGTDINYKVNCVINNEVIGKGEANGAREAGLKAAMVALANREVISKYNMIRMKTPREQSVLAERDGEAESKDADSEDSSDNSASLILPIEIPSSTDDDNIETKWKEELYKYLGSRQSLPEYKLEPRDSCIKTTLSINSVPVCYCLAKNGKKGSQNCAKYILQHPKLFKRCYVFNQ
ncbi:hypothetical protein FOA43_004421 [Brettanomyces nanus]|uniref:ribonuclease III n=1 Tax=Eeniella nana TaxID=13502 RepID=A0A875SEE3_EENNA|nr:uncharacterized protein FOA43_004421 [Brettanomyces nanus]QPG77024.1 hypothetical protein FOA43_004421 [Brettanomyces nanus]